MNIAEAPSSQELNFLAETFRLLGDPSRLKFSCTAKTVRNP